MSSAYFSPQDSTTGTKCGNASTQASVCDVIEAARSSTFATVSFSSMCSSNRRAYTSRKCVWMRIVQSMSTDLMNCRMLRITSRIDDSSA